MSPLRLLFALALCTAMFAGCPQYDGVDLQVISEPPIPPEFTDQGIIIVEGIGARIGAQGFLTDGEAISSYDFSLRSSDPNIFEVLAAPEDTWVFVGVRPGDAELLVRYDGSVKDRIRIRVREQAAPR